VLIVADTALLADGRKLQCMHNYTYLIDSKWNSSLLTWITRILTACCHSTS